MPCAHKIRRLDIDSYNHHEKPHNAHRLASLDLQLLYVGASSNVNINPLLLQNHHYILLPPLTTHF